MNLSSRAWRLQNLYTIKDARGRLVKFTPNQAQRHYYGRQHYCNHILKARKLGFSTWNMMDALDAMLHVPGSTVGVIDYSLPDAKKKLNMIRIAYDNLSNEILHGPQIAAIGRAIQKKIPMNFAMTEIKFANGSGAYAGTSLRGDTPTRLYISELGKTSIFAPSKAEEIKSGALNAITPGNLVTIESTHEGGKLGLHYELLQAAMENDPAKLSPIDFRFHFYPWYLDHVYQIHDGEPLREKTIEYFAKIDPQLPEFSARHDFPFRPLTHAQKRWYCAKEKQQRHSMFKEFPTLPGEAFQAAGDNAIYGTWMMDIHAENRLLDFAPNPSRPLYTFWDIGVSDFTSIWLLQLDGPRVLWLNWYENAGLSGGHYADIIRQWEGHYNRPINSHFLPHDAATRDKFSAKTYVTSLQEAGLKNIVVVPRTPDKWHGINQVRDLLPNSYFHKTHTNIKRHKDGKDYPSGFECLEGYSRGISRDGLLVIESVVHDHFSHTADAARTFGEAYRLGMIDPSSTVGSYTNPTRPKIIRPGGIGTRR